MDNRYQFDAVEQALKWSTEVLRKRRFPQATKMFQELAIGMAGAQARGGAQIWYGEYGSLPSDIDDRLAMALSVYSAVSALKPEWEEVLRLTYWGDYESNGRLNKMLKLQEVHRQNGVRVRLSYRYNLRQVGQLLGISHVTVSKRLQAATQALEGILNEKGLLFNEQIERSEKVVC